MTPNLTSYKRTPTASQPHLKSDWYVRIYFPDTRRRVRKPLGLAGTASKKEVAAAVELFRETELPALIEENSKLTKAKESSPAGASLRRLHDWYLDTYLPLRVKKASLTKARQQLGDFMQWCSGHNIGRVQQVSRRKLDEWLVWLEDRRKATTGNGYAAKTRKMFIVTVRAWFNAAVKHGLIESHPIADWDVPKVKPSGNGKRALYAHEVATVLHIIQEHDQSVYNLTRFLAVSGWRISDAMDFKWREVEFRDGEVGEKIQRIQIKTADNLDYPITPQIRECLMAELERLPSSPRPDGHVFTNEAGEPWTYNTVYRRMTRAVAAGGFNRTISPHVFRTTFATLAANGTPPTPPKVLQNLLGHSDINTTLNFYTQVTLSDMARWSSEIATTVLSESGVKS